MTLTPAVTDEMAITEIIAVTRQKNLFRLIVNFCGNLNLLFCDPILI